MDVPFYAKDNPTDCGCGPVCLKMALAYFDIEAPFEEIYQRAGSLGDVHYTLPWGLCAAVQSYGLRATFISKQPHILLEFYYEDIGNWTCLPRVEIENRRREQLQACVASPNICLLEWSDTYRRLPRRLVAEQAGVVIPTLWWGNQAHSVVLTAFEHGTVTYHDPNMVEGANQTFKDSEFFEKWLDARTDNDLLIVSETTIDL